MTTTVPAFTGWPADATVLLADLAADNTPEFWAAHRERYAAAVRAPLLALAAALGDEFGALRIFRPRRDRRFRPDAEPYRTDAGGLLPTAGGTPLAVVLAPGGLTVQAGPLVFDRGQLRRYRAAVDGAPGAELERVLDRLRAEPGLVARDHRPLVGAPRGYPRTHPRIALLRRRGLQVERTWPPGPWLGTTEPLERVRAAWRAAAPLARWLDTHVGPPAE
jgi:uncharacterized protein (DUF2461 family)